MSSHCFDNILQAVFNICQLYTWQFACDNQTKMLPLAMNCLPEYIYIYTLEFAIDLYKLTFNYTIELDFQFPHVHCAMADY